MLVIVEDVTRAVLHARDLEESRDASAALTERMAVGYVAMDAQWRITHANAAAVAVLGQPRERLCGGVVWDLFPRLVGSAFEVGYRRARDSGRPWTFDAYYPPPLDAWYEVRAVPQGDGVAVYFLDVSARVAARAEAEAGLAEAQLLADLSEELAQRRDPDSALAVLPQMLAPAVADWCIVTAVDASPQLDALLRAATGGALTPLAATALLGHLRDVAAHHRDPERSAALSRYAALRLDAYRRRPDGADTPVVVRALVDGEVGVLDAGGLAAVLATLAQGPAALALAELAPVAKVVVPLRARGRTVGLVSLFWDGRDDDATASPLRTGGPTPRVLRLLRTVADRVGAAVDSAHLVARQLQMAETLQRSLLTRLPQPDHDIVVARYTPAAEAAAVGGDWYDAFLDGSGHLVVVIGDVVGHDSASVADMAQVRSLVRAAAVMSQAGPAGVLTMVDEAMTTLGLATTASCVVTRLPVVGAAGRGRGPTELRWSSAGHPPPLVVLPDGSARHLGCEEADLLLGVQPGARRAERTVDLDRGSTVLLFTDGLVERRGEALDVGLARLASAAAAAHRRHRPSGEELRKGPQALAALQDFAGALTERMVPRRPTDDVALLALRLLPG